MLVRIGVALIVVTVSFAAGFLAGRWTASNRAPESQRARIADLPPDAAVAQPHIPPAPGGQPPPQLQQAKPEGIAPLERRRLAPPITGLRRDDLHDTFYERRGADRPHEAIDILAPGGTPVLAVDDGVIKKLFTSDAGGLTLYQFEPEEKYCYYYAHLDRYAAGIREGLDVRRGQVIAYVGSTGNASPATPHLHFAVFELDTEKRWWRGTPINPYALLVRALEQQ